MNGALSRRGFLGAALALGTGAGLDVLTPGLARATSAGVSRVSTLDDIEHFVILMQENRSFDHYFGVMSDVIGFDDPNALPGVFKQIDLDFHANPAGYVLPWRMDTSKCSAQSAGDLDHEWAIQHLMWNQGEMNQFLLGQAFDPVVMGYFNSYDIPYHYALADAFTICDRYHCSVLGPTEPNRLHLMSGTIDALGLNGGPAFENILYFNNQLGWESFPETLQAAGVDWYVYQENDNYGDNVLPYFQAFSDSGTDLYRRGNSFIPSTSLLGEATAERIRRDVLGGTLPQVSYIVGAGETTEHPSHTPGRGAQFIDQILSALTADLATWSKTLLIVNYDENDGYFDHVVPPTAPPFTEGEYLFGAGLSAGGILGPVGLGYRVPCFLVSPLTRGPLVCSDIFDHTSVIKLLEKRFNVRCPNISDWRRETVGDLTSAINFAGPINTSVPSFPDVDALAQLASAEGKLPGPNMPLHQSMPRQATSPRRGRPSGPLPA